MFARAKVRKANDRNDAFLRVSNATEALITLHPNKVDVSRTSVKFLAWSRLGAIDEGESWFAERGDYVVQSGIRLPQQDRQMIVCPGTRQPVAKPVSVMHCLGPEFLRKT